MATASRSQDLDVTRSFLGAELREHPGWFDFFQAVRLMHRMMPEREPVGRFGPPKREVLRFAVNNLLAFPPSQIQTLDWSKDGPARMKINFMGLTGPMGVLPYCYTELIRDRNRLKDYTAEEFFDLFNRDGMPSNMVKALERPFKFVNSHELSQAPIIRAL